MNEQAGPSVDHARVRYRASSCVVHPLCHCYIPCSTITFKRCSLIKFDHRTHHLIFYLVAGAMPRQVRGKTPSCYLIPLSFGDDKQHGFHCIYLLHFLSHMFPTCRILDDIGGAFGMGGVGGGLWHLMKGMKNSPGGARFRGGIEVRISV